MTTQAKIKFRNLGLPHGSRTKIFAGLGITHFATGVNTLITSEIKPRAFKFYSLCHLIKGRGWYWAHDQGRREVLAGQGVFTCPGYIMDYSGDGDQWVEDYLCFRGPLADQLIQGGVLKSGVLTLGPQRRLLPIIEMAKDPHPDRQLQAHVMLHELLVRLHLENKEKDHVETEDRIHSLCRELDRSEERWWTVKDMAAYCNMSLNNFRLKFQAALGKNPKSYLETLKIDKSRELLLTPGAQVAQVAQSLGYRDPFHFSRVFKRVTGYSPRYFQKQVLNNKTNKSNSLKLDL